MGGQNGWTDRIRHGKFKKFRIPCLLCRERLDLDSSSDCFVRLPSSAVHDVLPYRIPVSHCHSTFVI